jgi:hypothetical protein
MEARLKAIVFDPSLAQLARRAPLQVGGGVDSTATAGGGGAAVTTAGAVSSGAAGRTLTKARVARVPTTAAVMPTRIIGDRKAAGCPASTAATGGADV